MRRFSASDLVLKVLGLLLLAAAVLKGHELLTVPMANRDLWSWRPFLIFQVEFELVLAVWLLSGVFRRLAWLASLLCFGLFCCVTLYKGLTGAASCGCFGTVHISPWVTLLAIDLPAMAALSLFRPPASFAPLSSFLRNLLLPMAMGRKSLRDLVEELEPLPSLCRFAATVALGAAILAVTTPVLALNEPAAVTSTYEILEPKTWIGKELPILKYIDIQEQLNSGHWLILLYHHDCPDCRKAIPHCERMAGDLAGNEDFLRIAFVEVPPRGERIERSSLVSTHGQLSDVKEWFVTTPCVLLLASGRVIQVWQADVPDLSSVLESMQS